MSETFWTLVPASDGRITSKLLGENCETAVVRWGNKYRIINVVDRLPAVSLLWIFGCSSPVVLMSRVGSDVVVNYKGLSLTVKSWVLRSECTVPPNGPRACTSVSVDPERACHWSVVKPVGSRCVVLRRRCGRRTMYRGVFWQSPVIGRVLIQGVDVVWDLVRIKSGMCVVRHGGKEMIVHRTCLIQIKIKE
jgi:hypothetical protein